MGFLEDMRRRAEEGFAKGWQPSKGDELLGVVTDVDRVTTSKFGDYDVVTVRRVLNDRLTDERVAVHCFHTSLRTSMARRWPQPGGLLYLKFEGTRHNDRTDQDFESYAYDYLVPTSLPDHLRLTGIDAPSPAPQRPSSPTPAPSGPGYDEPF